MKPGTFIQEKFQCKILLIPALFLGVLFCAPPTTSLAQGWIIPERPIPLATTNLLELESQQIQGKFVDQVASYHIKQTFRNQDARPIEGVFYFPLPRGSQVTNFTYRVNNKEIKGELLEKEKARRIYEEIVRKYRDPALLEFLHQDLFRASIFPVPPGETCAIEIDFNQILPLQDEFYRIDYPLFQKRIGHQIRPFTEDARLTVSFELKSSRGIQHIYSPTQGVDIVRKNQQHTLVSFEGKIASIASDHLQLFYQLGSDEVGISVLSYRKPDEEGYFLFIASPKFAATPRAAQPKDVVFVIDVSGSMEGEKLDQAKGALTYCLDHLHAEDRFNIISFSTVAKLYREELQPVSEREPAKTFLRNLQARGGTNIHDALLQALGQNTNSDRLFTVVFLTDGLPTVGVQDENQILRSLIEKNRANVRIFSFGVGYDVNTFLIDQIASKTNAVAEYVKPDENIEAVVTSFYDKISSPVLTQLKLSWSGVSLQEIYPQTIPDLFKGEEMIVLGRYSRPGEGEMELSGNREGETYHYSTAVHLVESGTENEFIPYLWASRKIGYLLDQIRLHGSNKELLDEVIALSKRYGIVTPYTSYLAQEDWQVVAGIPAGGQRRVTPGGEYLHRPQLRNYFQMLESDARMAKSGEQAVQASEMIHGLMSARRVTPQFAGTVQHVAGRLFLFTNNCWREQDLGEELPVLEIQYGSPAYFHLIDLDPVIREIALLGEKIEFSFAGTLIRIDETGEQNLSREELKRRLKL